MTTTQQSTVLKTPKQHRTFFGEFYGTDVGKKWVMAVTGIIFLSYVTVHMIGNLKIYLGTDAAGIYHLDEYAEWLRSILQPFLPHTVFLWLFRIVVATALGFHLHAAYSLTVTNWKARGWTSKPVRYRTPREYLVADYASRTMRWSGVIILLFIIWHLLDLTFGTVNPEFVSGEVYHNVIATFSRWPVALFYIIANILLGFHIFHGAWSLFQSLGWNNTRFNPWRRWFATALALLIVVGNVSIPLAVMTHVVG